MIGEVTECFSQVCNEASGYFVVSLGHVVGHRIVDVLRRDMT